MTVAITYFQNALSISSIANKLFKLSSPNMSLNVFQILNSQRWGTLALHQRVAIWVCEFAQGMPIHVNNLFEMHANDYCAVVKDLMFLYG